MSGFVPGDVDRALEQLRAFEKAVENSLDDAAEAGTQVVQQEARQRAPRRTGKLREGIKTRPGRHQSRRMRTHEVYVAPFHGAFLEFGTRGSTVKPDRAKALQLSEDVFRIVTNPKGISPRPFFRPAIDTTRYEVARVMGNVVTRLVRLKMRMRYP